MTEIFKVEISLSPEHMNQVFYISQHHSPTNKFQVIEDTFQIKEDTYDKILHGNTFIP